MAEKGFILEISKFQKEDFEKYYSLVSNEQVMKMITGEATPLQQAKSDYEKILISNDWHPLFGRYKVTDKNTGNFIGLAKLEIKEKNTTEAELGYVYLPEYWGKGIGNEVAKILIQIGIDSRLLSKIVAFIDPNNIPSRKILENNGFVSVLVCKDDILPREELVLNLK